MMSENRSALFRSWLTNLVNFKLDMKYIWKVAEGWRGAEMPNKTDGPICVLSSEVCGTTNKKSNKKRTCAQKFHLVDVGEYLAWDSGHVTRGSMNVHVEYVSRAEI